MQTPSQHVIVCTTENGGIGKNDAIPWSDPEDMAYLKAATTAVTGTGNVLIMGYHTWKSIGRELPGRISVVITKSHIGEHKDAGATKFRPDLHAALEEFKNHNIFIFGGEAIYKEYLMWHTPDVIHHTIHQEKHECDRFFPSHLVDWTKFTSTTVRTGSLSYTVRYDVLDNKEEKEYLSLFDKIISSGNKRSDRTGTGTMSTFSERLEFDIQHGVIPVLTTKKVAFKTMAKELLWFMSGSTNSKLLEAQGVNIWKGNTSAEFLAKRGLPYQEGDLGPGYGFQWRHAGAKYEGMAADYSGKGVDQLQIMVDTLKKDPFSRRILLSAWNAADLDAMALPPCHLMYQLYVTEKDGQKFLSAQMYQRSCDSFLGCPFNIASYALLTHIIAEIVGMKPSKLTMVFGDYHIYLNHIDQVKEQLSRKPYPFPKIKFNRHLTSIDDVKLDDFELVGYRCHPALKAEMSV